MITYTIAAEWSGTSSPSACPYYSSYVDVDCSLAGLPVEVRWCWGVAPQPQWYEQAAFAYQTCKAA